MKTLLVFGLLIAFILGYPNGFSNKEANVSHNAVQTVVFVKHYWPTLQTLFTNIGSSSSNIGEAISEEIQK